MAKVKTVKQTESVAKQIMARGAAFSKKVLKGK
jgi:hypothetical protein